MDLWIRFIQIGLAPFGTILKKQTGDMNATRIMTLDMTIFKELEHQTCWDTTKYINNICDYTYEYHIRKLKMQHGTN